MNCKNNCRWGRFYQVWLRPVILPQWSRDQREEGTKTARPTGSIAVKLEVWNTHPRTLSFPASVGWSLKMWNSNHVVCWFWSCVWHQMVVSAKNAEGEWLYCVRVIASVATLKYNTLILLSAQLIIWKCVLLKKSWHLIRYINSTELINVKDIISLLHAINFVLTSHIPETHWKAWAVKYSTSFKNPTLLCCGNGIRKNKPK